MNNGPDFGRGLTALIALAALGTAALSGSAVYGVWYLATHLVWTP